MPKPIEPQESFADVWFPSNGIDISQNFEAQRQGTTTEGSNVRAFEPDTQRARGGGRPGITKYLDDPVIAGAEIQHLNFIVDPQTDALGISFEDAPGTDDEIDDPTVPTFFLDDLSINSIFPGGSGFSTNKNKRRRYPQLRLTAKSKNKTVGDTLILSGTTDFTSSGLKAGDTVNQVTLSSAGTPAPAPIGSYPINISNAQLTITSTTNGRPTQYRIRYITGTLTVGTASSVAFVQAATEQFDYLIDAPPNDVPFDSDVTAGNLLVVVVSSNFSTAATPTLYDSMGNAYVLAGKGVGGTNINGDPDAQNIWLWYAIASSSGPNTVSVNYTPPTLDFKQISLSVAEYSGLSGTLDAVVPGNNSYHAANPAMTATTQTIPVNLPSDLVIGAFSLWGSSTAVPDTGWTQRTVHPNLGIIIDNLDVSASVAATMTVTGGGAAYGYVEIGASFIKT